MVLWVLKMSYNYLIISSEFEGNARRVK